MENAKRNLLNLSRHSFLTAAVAVSFLTTFGFYVVAEKRIDRDNEARQLSLIIADELRQSSDDLTRMARTYVVTGNDIYRQHYQEILDIRDGKVPRPEHYNNPYWDLVPLGDQRPRPSGATISLLQLMHNVGVTEEEFAKLAEAKASSDALTLTEFNAMALVDAGRARSRANRDKAIEMLHDKAYHLAKENIMRPIGQFMVMAELRTFLAVQAAENYAMLLRVGFLLIGLLLIFLFRSMRQYLYKILGGSLDDLYGYIEKLGSGAIAFAIPVAKGKESSILGWLSNTQSRLALIETNRRQIAAELSDSAERYLAVIQSSQEAIVTINERGDIIDWNPSAEQMFGYSKTEILGQPVSLIIPQRHQKQHKDGFQKQLESGGNYSRQEFLDLSGRRKDGSEVPVEISVAGWIVNQDRFFTALMRDISERKRTEAGNRQHMNALIALNKRLEGMNIQLLHSEKMASIGQLAAGVAHEINNPLGFVLSNIGSLERYLKDFFSLLDAYEKMEAALNEESRDALQRLKDAIDLAYLRNDVGALLAETRQGIDRVRNIIKDLMSFSRKQGDEQWEWFDVHAGLDSTLNVAWNELKYRVTVNKVYGKLPLIYGLPAQINQVFMNLLVNAAQSIATKGTLTLRTGKQGDEVWIEVADSGGGIAPENLTRIFEPFFTTKAVGQGTGLGLSVSYSIVQKHQGRIEVTSELGKGTTFRVWLPIKPDEKMRESVDAEAELARPTS